MLEEMAGNDATYFYRAAFQRIYQGQVNAGYPTVRRSLSEMAPSGMRRVTVSAQLLLIAAASLSNADESHTAFANGSAHTIPTVVEEPRFFSGNLGSTPIFRTSQRGLSNSAKESLRDGA